MKVLKVKKTPKPKSSYKEAIPLDEHDDNGGHKEESKVDNSPKEEGDETEENKEIL